MSFCSCSAWLTVQQFKFDMLKLSITDYNMSNLRHGGMDHILVSLVLLFQSHIGHSQSGSKLYNQIWIHVFMLLASLFTTLFLCFCKTSLSCNCTCEMCRHWLWMYHKLLYDFRPGLTTRYSSCQTTTWTCDDVNTRGKEVTFKWFLSIVYYNYISFRS